MAVVSSEFKPGDILGFSGNCWESVVINLGTYGVPFWGLSHVGIVVDHEDGVLLFESTSLSRLPCVIAGKPVRGLQAHRIEDAVADYDGKVWLYSLYRPLYWHERVFLTEYLHGSIGRPYDKAGAIRSGGYLFAAIEALFRLQDTRRLFCSETVADALAAIGVFPTTNASRWNPNRLVRKLRREGILFPPKRLK